MGGYVDIVVVDIFNFACEIGVIRYKNSVNVRLFGVFSFYSYVWVGFLKFLVYRGGNER